MSLIRRPKGKIRPWICLWNGPATYKWTNGTQVVKIELVEGYSVSYHTFGAPRVELSNGVTELEDAKMVAKLYMDHNITIDLFPEHAGNKRHPPKYEVLREYIKEYGAKMGVKRYEENARNRDHPEWATA